MNEYNIEWDALLLGAKFSCAQCGCLIIPEDLCMRISDDRGVRFYHSECSQDAAASLPLQMDEE